MGESLISLYFLEKGWMVLPVYEKTDKDFKGPVLHVSSKDSLIAPDLLVFKKEKVYWIEAKNKSAFSWHRNTKRWVTGIDKHHFRHYLEIGKRRPEWPIWIFFLQGRGIAKDTPEGLIPPTGLFCNDLAFLKENINHESDNYGRTGMVYWSEDKLKKILDWTGEA